MAEKPGIAILLPDLRGGGAERVCLYLANELAARGFKTDLVLMEAVGELFPLVDPRVRVIELHAPRIRNAAVPLSRYLRRERPNALMAHMWPMPVVALCARALARQRTKLFGVIHTTWSRSELFAQPLSRASLTLSMRVCAPRLDGVVAVSHGVADDLSRISGVPRMAITTIHNPIASAGADAPSVPAMPEAWRDGTHARVLAVGTLKAIKDFPTLLRALARLRETRDARLLILGEGAERATLEALIDLLGLRGAVFLPGFSTNTCPYYAAAD